MFDRHGVNILDGGAGDDTLESHSRDAGQTLSGGAGSDAITNRDGRGSQISGGDGNDVIQSIGGAANSIDGGSGNDYLYLEREHGTTVTGGAGDDFFQLELGSRDNLLTGGAGADIFFFSQSELGTTAAGPHNTVTDFEHGIDKIDISGLYSSHDVSSIKHGKASDATTISGYQVKFYTANGNTYVIGDTDGVAGADFTIELSGTPKLKPDDFITSAPDPSQTSLGYDFGSLHQDSYWL